MALPERFQHSVITHLLEAIQNEQEENSLKRAKVGREGWEVDFAMPVIYLAGNVIIMTGCTTDAAGEFEYKGKVYSK